MISDAFQLLAGQASINMSGHLFFSEMSSCPRQPRNLSRFLKDFRSQREEHCVPIGGRIDLPAAFLTVAQMLRY
jgi:hypothetical protein